MSGVGMARIGPADKGILPADHHPEGEVLLRGLSDAGAIEGLVGLIGRVEHDRASGAGFTDSQRRPVAPQDVGGHEQIIISSGDGFRDLHPDRTVPFNHENIG